MNFIIAHYWISTMVAVAIVGGLVLWIASARTRRKENYPLPEKKAKSSTVMKAGGPPLLIQLPKLG